MNLIREDYFQKLDQWWSSNRKEAVLVLGVKEVGKTRLIKDWLKDRNIPNTFLDEKKYKNIKDIFNEAKSTTFDTSLAIVNKLMYDGLEKLIVIDGIMPNDEIIVQLKSLCSNSKHRYILISDYGEYVFNNIRFLPVGSMHKMLVKPLSFKEYCNVKFNKYMIDSLLTVLLNEEGTKLPFIDKFENAWEEYSRFGGFPSVVETLLTKGMVAADKELLRIKNEINSFVNNLPFSNSLTSLLDNFSNERSSIYKRYVFSSITQNGTYQRFKRAINILAKIGIIGVLPIEGEQVNFEYCDLFLCDPGLEYIWGSKTNREHVIESIVYSNGVRNGYKPYRLVLDANRIIDIVFDDQIPSAIDIKLRDTNSSSLSAAKFDYFREKGITYNPFILVDKGYTSSRHVDKAWILPIWAFLLME